MHWWLKHFLPQEEASWFHPLWKVDRVLNQQGSRPSHVLHHGLTVGLWNVRIAFSLHETKPKCSKMFFTSVTRNVLFFHLTSLEVIIMLWQVCCLMSPVVCPLQPSHACHRCFFSQCHSYCGMMSAQVKPAVVWITLLELRGLCSG